jgi:hypothetical protein
MNIYARHVASEGKKDFQKFSHTMLLGWLLPDAKNLEWDAKLGMKSDQTYKYGYLPEILSFPTDSIKQTFTTWIARASFHNIQPTSFGLTYAPEVNIHVFNDNHNNNESNTVVNLPLEKTVGKNFAVDLGLNFDLTDTSREEKLPSITQLTQFHPLYCTDRLLLISRPAFVQHGIIRTLRFIRI